MSAASNQPPSVLDRLRQLTELQSRLLVDTVNLLLDVELRVAGLRRPEDEPEEREDEGGTPRPANENAGTRSSDRTFVRAFDVLKAGGVVSRATFQGVELRMEDGALVKADGSRFFISDVDLFADDWLVLKETA